MDLNDGNYIDWHVKPVMKIKEKFGFRIIFKYEDSTQKVHQIAGFNSRREADKERDNVRLQLMNGSYSVFNTLKVSEFMDYWLENDIKIRCESDSTYKTFSGIVRNHIKPTIGEKRMCELGRTDILRLYEHKASESESVTRLVKNVMNISMQFAVDRKVINNNPAVNIRLPKSIKKKQYHRRSIDSQKTLRVDQVKLLIEKSKDTPIYMMVLLNVLMGLRRSEIIGVKYSDVDFINHTLNVQRQLGIRSGTTKEEITPGMFTKQEIATKTRSSVRSIPIPDHVFEAILDEQEKYNQNRDRLKGKFHDLGYICCSSYGRPRSKDFHWKYFKQLLRENNLPDIRWHDLRSTYATMLLKENISPKAVSKTLGHAKEIITIDVYGDNKEIISGDIPELDSFIKDVLPRSEDKEAEVQVLNSSIAIDDYIESKN